MARSSATLSKEIELFDRMQMGGYMMCYAQSPIESCARMRFARGAGLKRGRGSRLGCGLWCVYRGVSQGTDLRSSARRNRPKLRVNFRNAGNLLRLELAEGVRLGMDVRYRKL